MICGAPDTALFLVYRALDRGGSQSGSAYRIAFTTDDIRQLRDTFAAQWQRPPFPEEMHNLQESRIREEVLYREASSKTRAATRLSRSAR